MLSAAVSLLRLIPPWVLIVAAALAWGALQKHRATVAMRELTDLRADAAQLALQTAARTAAAHQEIAHAAQNDATRARADAGAATAALRGLQQRDAARARAATASAAAGGPTACDATGVPADVFQRVGEAAGRLAAIADQRGIAGSACERAYQSLTTTSP